MTTTTRTVPAANSQIELGTQFTSPSRNETPPIDDFYGCLKQQRDSPSITADQDDTDPDVIPNQFGMANWHISALGSPAANNNMELVLPSVCLLLLNPERRTANVPAAMPLFVRSPSQHYVMREQEDRLSLGSFQNPHGQNEVHYTFQPTSNQIVSYIWDEFIGSHNLISYPPSSPPP